MEKHKIYATGNETLKGEFNVSYYIFEKDSSFLDWLAKLLVEVFDIENGERKAKYVTKTKEDEHGNIIVEGIYLKNIKKMIDIHENYSSKGERVDVFYGKERVYVTLRKSREIRKRFAKFVLQTRDWIRVKKVEELPVYAGKRVNGIDL